MKKFLQASYDRVLPPAQVLWDMADADMLPVEAADGSVVDRPFFDLEISNLDTYKEPIESPEELITRSGRHIGFTALHQVEVNGIDHLARAIVTDGEQFTITSGTAWMTTIGGYAEDRAIKASIKTGESSLQVGPPHSGHELPFWLEGLRLPETIAEARQMSLAMTAQTEQLVFAALSQHYGLPNRQVALGDSRDSITTPGQYLYAPMYGSELLAFDTKARCAIDRVMPGDLLHVARWGAETIMGGIAVGICLAAEGQFGTLKGTTSLNPNFWASTLTGTLRSLAGGEGRLLIETVPADAHGIDVLYGRDSLSKIEEIKAAWQPSHPNVYIKPIKKGRHPSLLHSSAHKGTFSRLEMLAQEDRMHGGDVNAMDWRRVFGQSDAEEIEEAA